MIFTSSKSDINVLKVIRYLPHRRTNFTSNIFLVRRGKVDHFFKSCLCYFPYSFLYYFYIFLSLICFFIIFLLFPSIYNLHYFLLYYCVFTHIIHIIMQRVFHFVNMHCVGLDALSYCILIYIYMIVYLYFTLFYPAYFT